MLHTLLGRQNSEAESKGFCNYLKTHFGLVKAKSHFQVNSETFTMNDRNSILSFAFERYFKGR